MSMSDIKFKVVSGKISGKQVGDTITLAELDGINIEALVLGGHIEPANLTHKKSDKTEE